MPTTSTCAAPGATAAAVTSCYHCGEPVAGTPRWTQSIAGRDEAMCCPGCAAAAVTILELGLGDYYRQRDGYSPRPTDEQTRADLAIYDDPALAARFVSVEQGASAVTLTVADLRCSACAWLIEQRLTRTAGVLAAQVDYAARRVVVRWEPARIGLAGVLGVLARLGYPARPFTPDVEREQQASEARSLLLELGIAALFGMQVMMIAVAFYLDDGLDPGLAGFLRWASLLLTMPVIAYSARPFLRGAWRALVRRSVSMDVPVAAALLLAFGGSAWHTLSGHGAVYFDSVVMFVSLLGASRYLELAARVRAGRELDRLTALVPDAACRVLRDAAGERLETVAVVRLVPGDRVLVRAGEVVPVDGTVVSGESALDEAILTGEAMPRACTVDARVLGGSINLVSPLEIRVEAVASASFAGQLASLVARAAATRPAWSEVSGVAAQRFVWAVLLAAVGTWLYWSAQAPAQAFAATLAVLVVSCPCAFALAVPAALTAAHATLLGRGIAVVAAGALERLAAVTHLGFDQTGTLTRERAGLRAVVAIAPETADTLLTTAMALAQASAHPLSRSLSAVPAMAPVPLAQALVAESGRGVRGFIDGQPARLGSAAFIATAVPGFVPPAPSAGAEMWVARAGRVLGHIEFDDALREECKPLFAWLQARGLRTLILSGDRAARVAALGARLGAEAALGELTPEAKLAEVAALQQAGAVVAMIGDGLNDTPVLARADVSIAVAEASAAARQQADVLLLSPDLSALRTLLEVAQHTRRVMRQNLAWAALYNVLALPLAAAGLVSPWLAALGMSLSSLLVVGNALRLRRAGRGARAWT